MRVRRISFAALALLAVGALAGTTGCSDDPEGSSGPSLIVFNTEGQDLNAYDVLNGDLKQVVVSGNEDGTDPVLPAVNGQICFDPTGTGQFVLGDDGGQPNPPPGWSVMRLTGNRVGALSATRVARLIPTYQAEPDNYGCGYLSDGRLLTTDIGNSQFGSGNGQLIVWFPPFGLTDNRYCKLDIGIATAGGILIDEQERIYVASARGAAGIYRYTGPFPTSDDAAGGCGQRDGTEAPFADQVNKERFIPNDTNIISPNAIAGSGHGTFYVSSIINGVIAEYDADGKFLRRVLQPPPGDVLGTMPYSTGTPLGVGVDSIGTLYYADIGLVVDDDGIGPKSGLGKVRRIRFENGDPLPPETIDSGLNFPDGIGILER